MQIHTPLTNEMINSFPATNIHVHAPGVVKASTVLQLGLRNNLIKIENGQIIPIVSITKDNIRYKDLASILSVRGETDNGMPKVKYNMPPGSGRFKLFDEVMAWVQGHRYQVGAIMTPHDYMFTMQQYLDDCIANGLKYVKLQQNISMAHHLYRGEKDETARRRFFELLQEVREMFAKGKVELRFVNCYNKALQETTAEQARENSIRAAMHLKEAVRYAPGVYVGVQSAGSELFEGSRAIHHVDGYKMIADMGLALDGHAGEAAGVGYLIETLDQLNMKEIGHGFQVIESPELLARAREEGILFSSMQVINGFLGMKIHINESTGEPVSEGHPNAVEKKITSIWEHPFWDMIRVHKLNVAIATDNPAMGGQPVRETIRRLAGLRPNKTGPIPDGMTPLSAEELCICALNSVTSPACSPETVDSYIDHLEIWMRENGISVEHPLLEKRFKDMLKQTGGMAKEINGLS